jgi:hypothetical protein
LELNDKAEQTTQQDDIPQPPPPPPKLGACVEDDSLPEPEQLKAESIFFTSFEAHFGHSVSAGSGYRLWSKENLLLHF